MARKKLQKVFALLLAVSMTMSLLGVTAFANEEHPHNSIPCTECSGSGQTDVLCGTCGGSGEVSVEDGETGETSTTTCTACGGIGYMACGACGGDGQLECTGVFALDEENTTATCCHSGTIAYKCETCGADYSEYGIRDDHDPVLTEEKAPTCTEDGYKTYACEICSDFYTSPYKALGHDYDVETNLCTRCSEARPAEVGSDFKVGTLVYTIRSADTVAVTGWNGSDADGILVIPETVQIYDHTYTVTELSALYWEGENQISSLVEITIPDTVTKLGSNALNQSSDALYKDINLTAVHGGNGLTEIPTDAFIYQSNLTTIDGFENVTKIGGQAFYGCGNLGAFGEAEIGWDWTKITSIGEHAFDGCTSLNNNGELLDLQSLQEIGRGAFLGSLINRVKFPEGITEIPEYVFQQAWMLKEVILPNSVETIGDYAFFMDNNSNDRTVVIGSDNGSQLKRIGSYAFYAEPDYLQRPTYVIWFNKDYTSITIHASEDNIQIASNAFYDMESNVTFTVPSLETTKEAADLQQAINAASSGDTIVLTENYDIDEQVTIPAGKEITLVSEGEDGAVLKATLSDYMFEVPATASLTLGQGVTCMVRNARLVESAGTFTLDGATVTGGTADRYQGVVHIIEGGEFNMDAGTISGATVNNQHAGTVLLSKGAEMTMTGGAISENSAAGQLNSGAGVTVCQEATFTMEGGIISGNTAFRGAGVLVFGGTNVENPAYNEATAATFIMEGGTISGNSVSGWLNDLRAAGGGVYVQENARFIMNDGEISGNTSDHQGGGVATQDEEGNGGVFTMNGGTISGNNAVNGGGIYSYSKAVKLLAGHIEDNTASELGGGLYVSTNPYSIELGNALITANTATGMGGGVWACPIGTLNFADGNFALYGNTAGGAGDDVASVNKSTGFTTLGSNLPGGGVMAWYQDGGVYSAILGDTVGSIDTTVPRYAQGDLRIDAPQGSTKSFSAKAIVTDDAKALAAAAASLIITRNSAKHGGGVGSNGVVVLSGEAPAIAQTSVTKVWAGDANPNQPESVTVELVMTVGENEYVVDSVELSAANQWTYTFTYAPQEGATYTVKELPLAGYETAITGSAEDGFTVTNTYKDDGGYIPPDTPDPPTDPEDPGEEIPEEPTPGGELPEEPGEEIPEEPTPGGELPEEIPDEDVPQGEAPKTGDVSLLYAALAGVSGLGLAGTCLLGRKKRDE